MKNVWRLFVGDLKRLRANVVTIITIVGLIALPSIFSWYNMLACWDVFGNTGNLTVAVANTDAGYTSDLVPLEVNIGERVVSALRENDQLNWTFTDEEDAIDGTRSGRYYAAVVIPETFSHDMMSFFSDDAEHASIVYYSNEKKNAVAPKVTDQGADQVSRQVNLVFTETMSEVAIGVSQALARYTDDAGADAAISTMSEHLNRLGAQMGEAGSIVDLYADMLSSTQQLVRESGAMIEGAQSASHDVTKSAHDAAGTAKSIPATLDEAKSALEKAVNEASATYDALPAAIGAAFDSANKLSGDSAAQLKNSADDIDKLASDYRKVAGVLEKLRDDTGDESGAASAVITRLNNTVKQLEGIRDSLLAAASDIEKTDSDVQGDRSAYADIANQVKSDLAAARADYDKNLAPTLSELSDALKTASAALSDSAKRLDDGASMLVGETGSLTSDLEAARAKLTETATGLKTSGQEIASLGERITQAVSDNDMQGVRELLSGEPEALAQAISAPVALERHAVFPIENFGSAMSPLYTTLALWIGALLLMVTLKIAPSEKTVSELDDPTPRQLLLGRFGIVAFISFLQSTSIALGNLFFLGVQAQDPLLYLVCFWVSGLVFAFIIYTLVALFANFGKALSVILLIVQVSGGGGSFPLQLLPGFFQSVSPYLPITHAVNAMRAAMFGMYANDFWVEMGTLLLFTVPFAILGVALHAPLSRIVPKFVARVEKSKLM